MCVVSVFLFACVQVRHFLLPHVLVIPEVFQPPGFSRTPSSERLHVTIMHQSRTGVYLARMGQPIVAGSNPPSCSSSYIEGLR